MYDEAPGPMAPYHMHVPCMRASLCKPYTLIRYKAYYNLTSYAIRYEVRYLR